MSRTKKFLYNTLSTGIYQIIIMIAGFITLRIMLEYYGSEVNGLVSSILQFISYINLVEAGISGAAVYSLYAPIVNNDHKRINQVVSAAKKFYNKSGIIFVGLVIILSLIYPFLVDISSMNYLNVALLVLVLGCGGAIEFFSLGKYRTLLTADQKTYIISIASGIHIIINTLIVFLLATFGTNIILLRFIALFSVVLRSIILMFYVKRKYKYINYNEEPDYKALDKRWDALFLQMLGTIQQGAPVIIATICTTLKEVSIFSIYNMVMTGINSILGIFMSGLSASFGEIIAKKEQKTLQKSYKDFEFVYYMLITFVYSVAFIMIESFIKLYTTGITDVNYSNKFLAFLFVLNGLLYNIKTPQGMLVISAGLYKETKRQTFTQGAIIVILGFILAPFYGLSGIMVASCISNIYRNMDLIFFIPKNVTKLKPIDTVKNIISIFTIIIIVVLPGLIINVEISSYINWVIYAVIVAIYAVAVILIFNLIFNKEKVSSVLLRIKNMLKK